MNQNRYVSELYDKNLATYEQLVKQRDTEIKEIEEINKHVTLSEETRTKLKAHLVESIDHLNYQIVQKLRKLSQHINNKRFICNTIVRTAVDMNIYELSDASLVTLNNGTIHPIKDVLKFIQSSVRHKIETNADGSFKSTENNVIIFDELGKENFINIRNSVENFRIPLDFSDLDAGFSTINFALFFKFIDLEKLNTDAFNNVHGEGSIEYALNEYQTLIFNNSQL